ncbi:MAG TPA: ATP synthase subunit I [Hyphomicrobiales bacterium]|nr:ATP synthase subunit I [Hyphomicrobiales bacterium]
MPYILGALFFILGLIVGLFFFFTLRQTVLMVLQGGSVLRIGFLYVIRFILAGAVFYAAARAGLLEVLLAVTGFTLARLFVVRTQKAQ